MARKETPIDMGLVETLAGIHCTVEEIAVAVGVSKDTIERRCREAIERGRAKGRTSIRREQWKLAQRGDRTMLIWLGKQLLGQVDSMETKLKWEEERAQKLPDEKLEEEAKAILAKLGGK